MPAAGMTSGSAPTWPVDAINRDSVHAGASLSAVDVKALRNLSAQPGHRADIETLQPNPKTSSRDRDRICLRLFEQGWLDYAYRVTQFAIAPAGRLLLNLQTTSLPLTPPELWTLQACRASSTSPERLTRVPERDRQRLIRQLASRHLLTIKKRKLSAVWLTRAGQQSLVAAAPVAQAIAGLPIDCPGTGVTAGDLLEALKRLNDRWGTMLPVPIFRYREQ